MNRNDVDWEGPITAMITPFQRDGELEEPGLVPNGCSGEFWSQTLAERRRLAEIVLDQAKRRVPVIPGVGGNTTREVIELAQHAREIGCDGAMVMAPSGPSEEGRPLSTFQSGLGSSGAAAFALQRSAAHRQRSALRSRRAPRRLRPRGRIKDSTFDFNVF